MSSPAASSGQFMSVLTRTSWKSMTGLPFLSSLSVLTGVAITSSVGRRNFTPRCLALVRAAFAVSALSASTRDLPVLKPCANRKVYAIAPPTSKASALSNRRSITWILSDTFAPPRMTTNGRSGFSNSSPRNLSSRSINSPAAQGPPRWATIWATPTVEAWARCAAPNASFT